MLDKGANANSIVNVFVVVLVCFDAQRVGWPQRERRDSFVPIGSHVVVIQLINPHGGLIQNA